MWLFDGAMANGVTNGATESTTADAIGTFSVAHAGGHNTTAFAEGNLNLAAVQGNGSTAEAATSPADIGNVALNLGNRSSVEAGGGPTPGGFGNLAVNVCNTNQVLAIGGLNSAFNIGGTGNGVVAEGVLNNATRVGGNARSPKRPRVSNSGKVRPVDVVSVTCGDPVVWAGALPGSKWRRLRSGH